MKISVLLISLSVLAFVSCTPTMKPIENDKQVDRNKKNVDVVEHAIGKVLFSNSCAKCHDLPNPKDYNDDEWAPLVKAMAEKAKLNADQEELVYQYVLSEN